MPLRVVLVRTHNPGNLGAAARSAKNFGADLALIGPKADPLHPDALAHASGAEELLRGKEILSSWKRNRVWAQQIVGLTSLRGRVIRGLPPATSFASIRRDLRAGHRIALVFGPERSGLRTAELRECDARLRIPTVPSFPTLNLAQAVAIALALSLSFEKPRRSPATGAGTEPRATSMELERLKESLRAALAAARYAGPGRNAGVVAELESSLLRARLTAREVKLWLGAVGALAACDRCSQEPPAVPRRN